MLQHAACRACLGIFLPHFLCLKMGEVAGGGRSARTILPILKILLATPFPAFPQNAGAF